jgi:hypothetical protein
MDEIYIVQRDVRLTKGRTASRYTLRVFFSDLPLKNPVIPMS